MQPLERLVTRLDLDTSDSNIFVGGSGQGGVTADDRLFGGLVAAQAVVAACRTTTLPMHSMHAYFLRPGRPDQHIYYQVTHAKDGKVFHARNVAAFQNDEVIFQLQASFTEDQDSVTHQDPAPQATGPEDAPNRDELRGRDPAAAPIDVRMATPLTASEPLPPSQQIWFKPNGTLPDDPVLHLALLVYASDRGLLDTAWRPHADQGELAGASLDHSVWIHSPPQIDDWHLYSMTSPAAGSGRGLAHGAIYDSSGARVASVTQEGVLRIRPTAR